MNDKRALAGHNVFRVVPNEVPILCILALVSMRLRSGGWNWSSLGFRRPASWRLVVLIALAAAALRIVLGDFVIDPLTARLAASRRAAGDRRDHGTDPRRRLSAVGPCSVDQHPGARLHRHFRSRDGLSRAGLLT